MRAVPALLLLTLLFAAPVAAREKLCLVLGGGGARGAAHIGVLKVLERERIPVDCIAGTSMGAVIGAMYASGYTPDEIGGVLAKVDWRDLFDDDPAREVLPIRRKNDALDLLVDFQFGLRDGRIALPTGALQGQKLLLLLRRLTLPAWRVEDFDALPIPFRAVATDIGTGEAVVFGEGDLALALRASMSVPAVFAPIRVDGRLLIDGAIADNVPIAAARAMGAERLVAVDVSALLEPEENLDSAVAISAQMLTALMKRMTAEQLATLGPRDVLITPELTGFSGGSFERSTEAIPRGVAAAEAVVERLRPFAVGEAEWQAWRARQQSLEFDAPLVSFLDTLPHDSRTAGYVEQRLARNRGKPFDAARVESDIGTAFGEGSYEQIAYRLVERDGLVGLEVEPVDKGWGPNYLRFGLDISDDFEGESDYALTVQSALTGLDDRGAEWRNTLRLGRVTGLRSEYYQPLGARGRWFANGYLDYRALDQPLGDAGRDLATYRLESTAIGVEGGVNVSGSLRVLAGVQRGHDAARVRVGDRDLYDDVTGNFGGWYLGLTRDTLDDSQFPGAGDRVDVRYDAFRAGFGAGIAGDVLRVTADKALSRGKNRLLLGVRASSELDGDNLLRGSALLGGFLNLSGFAERELFGAQVALARAVYYRRLGDESALFSLPFYVGGSLEAGNVWERRDAVDVDSLIVAGSVFVGMESFLGPMFLGIGHADTGDTSLYLRFGSLLRTDR